MKKLLLTVVATLATTLVPLSASAADEWPGYFAGNGSDRYMLIPNSDAFTIPASGVRTVSMKVKVNGISAQQSLISNRIRNWKGADDTKARANGDVSGMMLQIETTGNLTVYVHSPVTNGSDAWHTSRYSGSSELAMTSALPKSDDWVYISWVFDGTDQTTGNRCYRIKDGTLTSATKSCVNGFGAEIPSYGNLVVGTICKMKPIILPAIWNDLPTRILMMCASMMLRSQRMS
jgi:hypothetical protein